MSSSSNSQIDPALSRLLSLSPESTSISSHGGGGMSSASTSKISTTLSSGAQKDYFLKTGTGRAAEVMFEGEHASLNAVHNAVPSLCPRSYGWGQFEGEGKKGTSFLVTDFLELGGRRGSAGGGAGEEKKMTLAQKMAKLHTTPAPVPEGFERPMFGFPVTTCCGDTPQDNTFSESWAEFFAERRLRFILKRSEKSNGADAELKELVEKTTSRVVPRLLGDGHLGGKDGTKPVVVHGDLWSGNASRGTIMDGAKEEAKDVQDVVYDPSACYAHGEYDLGIMKMFGGFGSSFFEEYHELCPKTEPVSEYEDRISLYELYHHLNHHALFGGGYRSGAVSIMKKLISKYGDN